MFSALTSAVIAWFQHREKKDDERLVFGKCYHPPNVKTLENRESVIAFQVFNKSNRKAYISTITAIQNRQQVDIRWGSKIDDLGNVLEESSLVGVIDSASLYVCKQVVGEIYAITLRVTYSFDKDPKYETLEYCWGSELDED